MSVEIVLKYSLIVVIYSVVVLGSDEVKTNGNSVAILPATTASKIDISKKSNDSKKFVSEAGTISIDENHGSIGKSRKRPPLSYPKDLSESESTEKKSNNNDVSTNTTTNQKNIIPEKTKNNTSNSSSSDADKKKPKKDASSTVAPVTSTTVKAKLSSTTTTVKSTTTSTTTTTTTTTTQKPIPKKPLIAINADDNPDIARLEKKVHQMPTISIKENLVVEEPIAELSQERNVDSINNSRYMIYVILVVGLPTVIIALAIGYRRFREHWHTRQYRRVDFLVDGMYAD